MNKLKVLMCFSVGFLTLTSCLSTKKLIENDFLPENNFRALNGIYENIAVNTSDNPISEQFLYVLLFKMFGRQNRDEDYDGKIIIRAISDRKIQVDYIVKDEIRESQKFKGEIKNNFFVIKRKWKLLGLPPILGFYDETKIALGLSEDDLLYVRKGFYSVGGLIFFAAGNEEYKNWQFRKIGD